ncbi:MAG: hypothetical protein GVY19_03110 [Bacteroidetes bacterium]|jgi:hypothetical protein|nr:hypothetical protein [Bacteroidota bacterium]
MEFAFRSTKFAIYFGFLKYPVLLFALTVHIQAQIVENFEENLSGQWVQSTPNNWDITENQAISGLFSLQHIFDNQDAGHDQIALKHKPLIPDSLSTIWSFRVRHGQNPSASNNWCVFPVSDASVHHLTPDLIQNAYCVGVNFTGNDDELKLWSVKNGILSTRIDTDLNWQDSIGTELAPYIEIHRSVQGLWELFINIEGDSTQLTKLGQVTDQQSMATTSFGIYYAYTQSYDRALWFDNLSITGAFVSDTVPPAIEAAYFLTDTLIKIKFNEPCNAAGFIHNNIFGGIPGIVKHIETISNQECRLWINPEIGYENPLDIHLNGIEDLSGNFLTDTILELNYYQPDMNDLIISEVMYDPTPVVGLPDVEYIEVLNTSPHSQCLYQWELNVGEEKWILPDKIIAPGEYMIVCQDAGTELFGDSISTMPLFTSKYSLSNDGDSINIKNEKGVVINAFVYHPAIHANTEKQNGGWSLEIIDPLNQCHPAINWSSSKHSSGGTPGRINSVHRFNQDAEKPMLNRYNILDSKQVQLVFSEPIQKSALNTGNFTLNPDLGQPKYMRWINDTTLNVSFQSAIEKGKDYQLSITEIIDLCGNVNTTIEATIQWVVAQPNDVLITEIMADPVPVYGLPEEEYIELYNRSNYPVNLDKWQLFINGSISNLPFYNLDPDNYVVLANESAQNKFPDSVNMLLFNLPAIANNEGEIALLDSLSMVIHATTYNKSWMASEYKQNGGWSLEMTDIHNPCDGELNWQESINKSGGTPGEKNSVSAANRDTKSPFAKRIGFTHDSILRIHFSEPLDTTSVSLDLIRVNDEIIPHAIDFEFPMRRYIDVYFTIHFDSAQSYQLQMDEGFADCAGNRNQSGHTFQFSYPQQTQKQDVIMNELMFNPLPGGPDYIEMINRSDKILDLKELALVSLESGNQFKEPPLSLSESSYLLYPDQLFVVSSDTTFLSENYESCNGFRIETTQMPSMPYESGGLALINQEQVRIDSLYYDHSWHSDWVKNEDGVALERLNPNWPGQQADNWRSGIAATHYGTPGCKNANFTSGMDNESKFTAEPRLITPNADGYQDEVIFTYALPEGNYILHAWIYNSNGQFVVRIKQDELVSHNGFFTWDGRNRNDLICPIGIYLVYVEFVSESGHVEVFKETCVVGRKVQ